MIAKVFLQIRFIEVFFVGAFVFLHVFEVSAYSVIVREQQAILMPDSLEQVDSLEAFVNQDVLVLGRYGGMKRKWVKKGTLLKVYAIPFFKDSIATTNKESFFSGKDVYRGHFETLIGDTLTLIQFGKELKFDIDNLHQVKVFNDVGARVFGDMVNLASFVGFGYSGLLVGVGAAWTMEEEPFANAFAGPLMSVGAGLGGLSYLLHRLGLIIRRNKYDLISDWYIVRST